MAINTKKGLFFMLALWTSSLVAYADENPAPADSYQGLMEEYSEAMNQAQKYVDVQAKEAQRILQPPPGSVIESNAAKESSDIDIDAMIEQFNRAQQGLNKVNDNNEEDRRPAALYAFVSFSVPEHVLRVIAQDVQKAGGVMVLRGFKEETNIASTARELKKLNDGVGAKWSIDPDLFSSLGIEKVPAIAVVMKKPGVSVCSAQDACQDVFDAAIVYGDINIPHAMRRIMDNTKQKEMSAKASEILSMVEMHP